MYSSYNEGSQNVIKIFCDFISGERRGYSYLSTDTLTVSVNINNYYNRKDHVMLRHLRNDVQYESKMEVLPHYRDMHNVSVFNTEHPDFSGSVATKPYLFISFIPISIGNHTGLIKGYTSNGHNYSFSNTDENPNNFIAIFESSNTTGLCWPSGTVKDGWKDSATAVGASRNIPAEVFFNSNKIGMGGGGCLEVRCDTTVIGLAFGLPFEY